MDDSQLADINDTFAKIGLIMCNFANFEGYLAPALAMMLNDNGDQASAILGQVDSFAFKWAVIVGIAGTREADCEVAKAILAMDEDIKKAAGFRNKLAHSGSRIKDGVFWLITNANTTKRGESKAVKLTRQEIWDHNELLKNAIEALSPLIDKLKLTGTGGLMRALRHTDGASTGDPILNLDRYRG